MRNAPTNPVAVAVAISDSAAGRRQCRGAGPRPGWSRSRRPRARGYTLIEMVMASVSMTILMVASVALLDLVLAAMPTKIASIEGDADAIADDLAERLALATEITSLDPDVIEFVVPDEDGDAVDEGYGYYWSTKPGDPILMQRDGLFPVVYNEAVNAIGVSHVAEADPAPGIAYESLSAERELAWDGSKATVVVGSSLGTHEHLVRVFPTLSVDAVRWSVDRIEISMAGSSFAGSVDVRFYVISSGWDYVDPINPGTAFASTTFDVDDLDGSRFVTIDWMNLPELATDEHLVVGIVMSDDEQKSDLAGVRLGADETLKAKGYFRERDRTMADPFGPVIPIMYFHGRETTVTSRVLDSATRYRTASITIETDAGSATRDVVFQNAPEAP